MLNIAKVKSFKGVTLKLEPVDLHEAERFWIREAQKFIPKN